MCRALCEVIVNKILCLSTEDMLVNETPDVNHKRPQQFTIKLDRIGAHERTEEVQFL